MYMYLIRQVNVLPPRFTVTSCFGPNNNTVVPSVCFSVFFLTETSRYLLIFLKFVQAVIPTIEYDYTRHFTM